MNVSILILSLWISIPVPSHFFPEEAFSDPSPVTSFQQCSEALLTQKVIPSPTQNPVPEEVNATSIDPSCTESLEALLQTEYHRVLGDIPGALAILSQSRREIPDCIEAELLYAEILFGSCHKNPSLIGPLEEHLESAMSLFKNRFEFPLMALEARLFISTPKKDVHELEPLVSQLQNLLHGETKSPLWARSQFHELKAEIANRRNLERESAQELLSAWTLNKENAYLLAEAAEMYSRFGMIRTAKRTYEQYLNTKLARTGILDRSIQIRLQHKNLLLNGTSAVDDFVAVAYNDNTVMEAAERILEVGRTETCMVLLNRVSRQVRKSIKFKLIALKHAKLSHDYDRAVIFSHQILREKSAAGHYDNKAMEAFLEACLMADKELQAIKWCEEQKIQPATMAVFPRALLSLMIYKKTQDRTFWNRIFYTSELTSNLEAFRKESEKNGLETTLQRIKLRRYHMVRDTDGVNRVISEMTDQKKPPFDVALEIADTLADLNEADRAFALYEGLLKEHPDNALVLNNYGFFLCSSPNRIRKAEMLIRRALQIDPDNPAYCDSLSWLLFLKGLVPEAKKVLESCLKPNSQDSVMLEHMGDICHALGDENDAMNYWSRALKLRPPSFFDILDKLDPP